MGNLLFPPRDNSEIIALRAQLATGPLSRRNGPAATSEAALETARADSTGWQQRYANSQPELARCTDDRATLYTQLTDRQRALDAALASGAECERVRTQDTANCQKNLDAAANCQKNLDAALADSAMWQQRYANASTVGPQSQQAIDRARSEVFIASMAILVHSMRLQSNSLANLAIIEPPQGPGVVRFWGTRRVSVRRPRFQNGAHRAGHPRAPDAGRLERAVRGERPVRPARGPSPVFHIEPPMNGGFRPGHDAPRRLRASVLNVPTTEMLPTGLHLLLDDQGRVLLVNAAGVAPEHQHRRSGRRV